MAKRAMTDEAKAVKANLILDQAAECFLSMDYERIKMADLAKMTGLSNGTLFVYFKSKETLFLCLLWREYEKRMDYLEDWSGKKSISCFEDVKRLFLEELEYLIDNDPLYIKLESMRSAVLERNTDIETRFQMKKRLFGRLETWSQRLSQSGILSQRQLIDIFIMESAIITGCKLVASIPCGVGERMDDIGAIGMRRDFKDDVLLCVRCYLDGYGQRLE